MKTSEYKKTTGIDGPYVLEIHILLKAMIFFFFTNNLI